MNTVSPVEENIDALVDVDAEDEKLEESDHQSKPLKDPPMPTVPIREKSTWGKVDGAGVAAIAGRMYGRRNKGGRANAMVCCQGDEWPIEDAYRSLRMGRAQ